MRGWICNSCWKDVPQNVKERTLTIFRIPVKDGPKCNICGTFEELETKILATNALSHRWLVAYATEMQSA